MIGWVDFSAEERKRADAVLELAKTQGAIDEIGIGVLRDGFADLFFPGTSTLHTRPRYFYLIAYAMKDLENNPECVDERTTRRIIDSLESETADKLIAWAGAHGEPTDGITGCDMRSRGEWVKRAPSVMDWSALATYGLLSDPEMKRSGYLNMVSRKERSSRVDETEEHGEVDASGLWNVPWSTYKGWNDGSQISLNLLPEEARDLRERICRCRSHPTLYSALLKYDDLGAVSDQCSSEHQSVSFIEFVDSWLGEMTGIEDCLEACELAADLSALATMLHVRFNYILRERARVLSEEDEAYRNWMRHYDWRDRYYDRACRCDIQRAFDLLGISRLSQKNRSTRAFLEDSRDAIASGSLKELDQLIDGRELILKGETRSKLKHAAQHCDNWFGGYELTYRFEVALKFALEIEKSSGGEVR